MPTVSFAGGIDASYEVAAGRTVVIVSSNSQLKVRSAYVGTGQMVFHWVSDGKNSSWRCDTTMLEPRAVQVTDVSKGDGDGVQRLMVPMGDLFPAGLLIQGRMEGTLLAPAIHLDFPWWQDVWVFLIRSPWYPLKLQLAKTVLAVAHGLSRVTASMNVSGAGLTAQFAVDGQDFKGASLAMIRTLGSYSSKEEIGELSSGGQTFQWTPISRAFDLLLVTHHSISESQLAQVAAGMGAQESKGFLGPGSMEGDFVLCDGPAMGYSVALKAHRGLLENEEDLAEAKLTW